jgi:hypothetical protein
MPFEMQHIMAKKDRLDLDVFDVEEDDWAGLEFVREWLRSGGDLRDGMNWRGSRLEAHDDGLRRARNYRGVYKATRVARFHEGGIELLGQARGGADTAWLRDAVYVGISREMGVGRLSPDIEITRWGSAGGGEITRHGGQLKVVPTVIRDNLDMANGPL